MGRAENKVAKHLKRRCTELGVIAEKVHAEDRVGCPDYILTFPDGYVSRMETKSDEGEVSPMQGYYHRMLFKNRCKVIVPTCVEDVEAYLHFEMKHHAG